MMHIFRNNSQLSALLRPPRLVSLRNVQSLVLCPEHEVQYSTCRQIYTRVHHQSWHNITRNYSQTSNIKGDGDKSPNPDDPKNEDRPRTRADDIDEFRRPDGYYPTDGIQPEEQKDHKRHEDYMRYRKPPSFDAVDEAVSVKGSWILVHIGLIFILALAQ
ncbi:hypothetical protein O0L34_g12580 [Tuta absoluta]|nr:hypothetical protein O0L34_g12580 [Tuta absoluta]